MVTATDPILIISHDVVGPKMAGPGIRYWELAHVLTQFFPVVLATPNAAQMPDVGLQLWTYQPGVWESIAPVVEAARAIVLCGDVLAWFPQLRQGTRPLVIDGYDPQTLETLAMFTGMPEQAQRHQGRERILQMQCRAGDFFICASERQRDWWLGLLEAAGRINIHTYNADSSLRQLIDVVPFGLPSRSPQHNNQVLKGVWPGIGLHDKVILWGGGLWQWLDPLTAIRAVAQIREQRDDVRLVFPGTRHPNVTVPEMPMVDQSKALAEALGLLGRYVFFGDWVAYNVWPDYLLEADMGLSLHFDTLETRMAFRTRVLDYIWAGLPMVLTEGDTTGDLMAQSSLGRLVAFEDVDGVAEALLDVLAQPRTAWEPRFGELRAQLTWERAAAPLVEFCRAPYFAADKNSSAIVVEDACVPILETQLCFQHAELARLQALVDGYERGRFIRLMKWLRGRAQPRS